MGLNSRLFEGYASTWRPHNSSRKHEGGTADKLLTSTHQRYNRPTRPIHLQAPLPKTNEDVHRNALTLDLLREDRRSPWLIYDLH